jgi:hypothetical protein
MHCLDDPRGGLDAASPGYERRGLVPGERFEVYSSVQALSGQGYERLREGRRRAGRVGAVGTHNEESRITQLPGQVQEYLEGRTVSPMQVVKAEEQS